MFGIIAILSQSPTWQLLSGPTDVGWLAEKAQRPVWSGREASRLHSSPLTQCSTSSPLLCPYQAG